ncbi:hypothetical protein PQ478_09395 [Alkalihalophilus pseudofirmus]|uniref:hypothetical protein n=1 Tax=Alkalihalophilus pseudofirmus TaxID=79885 RepID=UPI00259B8275|nr:hypothetical protein [Alkalihalophilus pseudofirmus]WEG18682.1 hypothetical protein PQ478_09395 [Alkalihalophilus pseudofirmus]
MDLSLVIQNISEDELDELKSITPSEFYEMSSVERLTYRMKAAFANFHGLLDIGDWLNAVEHTETKIKWVGHKGEKIEYFPSHKEVEDMFGRNISSIGRLNLENNLDGWKLHRVNKKIFKDHKGNILDVK